jgi:hypothetical protein
MVVSGVTASRSACPAARVPVGGDRPGCRAWRVDTGEPPWSRRAAGTSETDDARETDDPEDPDDSDLNLRIGFSGDGRLVAIAGSARPATVRDSSTGRVVLSTGRLAGYAPVTCAGPAALDGTGQRHAYPAAGGTLVVRDVPSGRVVLTVDSGLAVVNAIALAPDGSGIVAAGRALGGTADLVAGTRYLLSELQLPDGDGGRRDAPCSQWPVQTATTSSERDLSVFDSHSRRRGRQSLRRPLARRRAREFTHPRQRGAWGDDASRRQSRR